MYAYRAIYSERVRAVVLLFFVSVLSLSLCNPEFFFLNINNFLPIFLFHCVTMIHFVSACFPVLFLLLRNETFFIFFFFFSKNYYYYIICLPSFFSSHPLLYFVVFLPPGSSHRVLYLITFQIYMQ